MGTLTAVDVRAFKIPGAGNAGVAGAAHHLVLAGAVAGDNVAHAVDGTSRITAAGCSRKNVV